MKFELGKSYKPKQQNTENSVQDNPDEILAFENLRQRQSQLGVLNAHGDLYDPVNKK